MNLIDTNGVAHVFATNKTLRDSYYLASDVADEVEMTELVHGRHIPAKISHIEATGLVDQAIYLQSYKETLNKYGGRSFYNMTGFGDVSIIATVHSILDAYRKQQAEQLFDTSEPIVIFTDDVRLTANLTSEFSGKAVSVQPTSALK